MCFGVFSRFLQVHVYFETLILEEFEMQNYVDASDV